MESIEIINESLINFHPKSRSKEEAVDEMARMLRAQGKINDLEAFTASVWDREKISSTDTGVGVAIPHGKDSGVVETSVALCRFDQGLVWDEDPVKAVFMLAVDDDEEGLAHLELIAKVSTLLMDDDFLESLFTAESEVELYKTIMRKMEEEE